MQVKDEAELFDYMFTSLEDTPDVSTECKVCLSGHLWLCGVQYRRGCSIGLTNERAWFKIPPSALRISRQWWLFHTSSLHTLVAAWQWRLGVVGVCQGVKYKALWAVIRTVLYVNLLLCYSINNGWVKLLAWLVLAGTIQGVVTRNDKTHTFSRANQDCKMTMLQAPQIIWRNNDRQWFQLFFQVATLWYYSSIYMISKCDSFRIFSCRCT